MGGEGERSAEKLAGMMRTVMESAPDLTWRGFEVRGVGDFDEARASLLHPETLAQFERALAWLDLVPMRKAPNRQNGFSYGLKHTAEGWARGYVSNGALIAAALALGFPVAPADGPNAYIGVSAPKSWPPAGSKRERT